MKESYIVSVVSKGICVVVCVVLTLSVMWCVLLSYIILCYLMLLLLLVEKERAYTSYCISPMLVIVIEAEVYSLAVL